MRSPTSRGLANALPLSALARVSQYPSSPTAVPGLAAAWRLSNESSEPVCCSADPRPRPSSRSVRMTAAPAAPAIKQAVSIVTRFFQTVRCIGDLFLIRSSVRSSCTLQQQCKSVEEGGGEDHPDLSSPPPHTTPRGGICAAQMTPNGQVERCQERKC